MREKCGKAGNRMSKIKWNILLIICIVVSGTFSGCVKDKTEMKAVWTEKGAEDYYDDLKGKMRYLYECGSWKVSSAFSFTYPELRAFLELYGIEHPVGFTDELQEISEEDAKGYIEGLVNEGYMRRDDEGNLEPIGHFRRAILPLIDPYAYVEVTSEKLDPMMYYFHDTYLSEVDYYRHIDEYDPNLEKQYIVSVYPSRNTGGIMYPGDIKSNPYKYKIVNCKTGEEKEYIPDAGATRGQLTKEILSILDEARKQSESIDSEKHPKMVYECIRDLMEVVGTDVSGAKLLYEDCCWGTGTDVESIESYDADTRTLLVKGMDRMEYECRLDEDGDVNEVYEKGGECVFHDDSKKEQPGKRKKSLVDLSILKN